MKVRTDFVTNSSSSSFTVVSIQSKKVDEFVKGQLCTPEEADKWLNTKEFLTRLSECLGMKDGDERAGYGFPVGLAPVETLIALIAKAKKLDRFLIILREMRINSQSSCRITLLSSTKK